MVQRVHCNIQYCTALDISTVYNTSNFPSHYPRLCMKPPCLSVAVETWQPSLQSSSYSEIIGLYAHIISAVCTINLPRNLEVLEAKVGGEYLDAVLCLEDKALGVILDNLAVHTNTTHSPPVATAGFGLAH